MNKDKDLDQDFNFDGAILTRPGENIIDNIHREIGQDTEKTLVVFRYWYKDKNFPNVIALFPEVKYNWRYCSSYEHVGQHGGADYQGVVAATRPASESKYRDLKQELESIGYNLDVRKKYIRKRG